jgi:endonuclease-3
MPKKENNNRIEQILSILRTHYPGVKSGLRYNNPLEMLISTILSAQCTDVRVNAVTEALFKELHTAEDFAQVPLEKLEDLIRSTGFYRSKAKNIKACCQQILSDHKGQVPATMEALVQLPGVGRKTANVVLGNAFGIPGIVVDTHVKRLAQRIGLTEETDPVKIEFDLMACIPKKSWIDFSHQLIWHGRRICGARKPKCPDCPLLNLCDYGQRTMGMARRQ